MDIKEVQDIVLNTLKEFSEYNGINIETDISLTQRLIGSGGLFDSMDLVNFITDLEEVLENKYDKVFSLQDERAMSRSHSPFMNPQELSKFIIELNEDE